MSFIRDTKIDHLLQPFILSLVAFAIGYQTRSYFSPAIKSLNENGSTTKSIPNRSSSKDQKRHKSTRASPPSNSASASASASDSDSDSEIDTDSEAEDLKLALSSNPDQLKPTTFDEVKLVLVVNDSLKMSKGKIAAQAGHATLGCALMMKEVNPRMYKHWERHGQPKIAVRCADTAELEALAAQARQLKLCARTIQDAGRTQVAPGSKTILGIGPGPARIINQVTGKLKLL